MAGVVDELRAAVALVRSDRWFGTNRGLGYAAEELLQPTAAVIAAAVAAGSDCAGLRELYAFLLEVEDQADSRAQSSIPGGISFATFDRPPDLRTMLRRAEAEAVGLQARPATERPRAKRTESLDVMATRKGKEWQQNHPDWTLSELAADLKTKTANLTGTRMRRGEKVPRCPRFSEFWNQVQATRAASRNERRRDSHAR